MRNKTIFLAVLSALSALSQASEAATASLTDSISVSVMETGYGTAPATSSYNGTALGLSSNAGFNSVSVGNGSLATYYSTAEGVGASAADYSSALGYYARAIGTMSLSVGNGANSIGNYSTAIGAGTLANGLNSTAIANTAIAQLQDAIAIGYQAKAGGQQASPCPTGTIPDVGSQNPIAPGGTCSSDGYGNPWDPKLTTRTLSDVGVGAVSLGNYSQSLADNSTAIGFHSSVDATATNAIALGAYSRADVANTASFGTVGNERRLVNVAAGINQTDAANLGQVNAVALDLSKTAAQVDKNLISIANNANAIESTNKTATSALAATVILNTQVSATGVALQSAINSVKDVATATGALSVIVNNNSIALASTTAMASDAFKMANNSLQYNANHNAVDVAGDLNVSGSILGSKNVVSIGQNAVQIISGSIANNGFDRITTDSKAVGGSDLHLGGSAVNSDGSLILGKVVATVVDGGLIVSSGHNVNMSGNKIGNVGSGVLDTDASNVGQVKEALASANSYTDATVSSDQAQITHALNAISALNTTVNGNRRISSSGIAQSMAIQANLPALTAGENAIGIGMATFDGQSAIGFAFAHGISEHSLMSAGFSYANGVPALRAGYSLKW